MPSRLHESLGPWLAVVIFGVAFVYFAHQPITHDTAWFMYAARGMLEGGTLYRDFVDVNAPLAYLTLMPAAALSNLPFFSDQAALTLNILAFVLIAYVLSGKTLHAVPLRPRDAVAVRAALLVIMCFLPGCVFGQREHIFAVLMIPYAMAAALRFEKKPLRRNLAIACGIAGGFAISIKLPFVIVAAFIEAAVLMRRGLWKITLTSDLIALAVSAAVVNLICFALYPSYWTEIVPSAVALYGPYNNIWFLTDALLVLVPMFFAGLAGGEYRGKGPLIKLRLMLVAATVGAFALFILQRKGWPHHALPIVILSSTLFIFNLADIEKQAAINKFTAVLRTVATLGALGFAFYLGLTSSAVDPGMIADVEARVKQTDGSFYIISTGNYPAFPLALNRAYRWTSRFPQLIMLPGLIEADRDGHPSRYENSFRRAVLEDIQKGKPTTIFLYMPVDAGSIDGNQMIGWLRADPAFDAEWTAHYRESGPMPLFVAFERVK